MDRSTDGRYDDYDQDPAMTALEDFVARHSRKMLAGAGALLMLVAIDIVTPKSHDTTDASRQTDASAISANAVFVDAQTLLANFGSSDGSLIEKRRTMLEVAARELDELEARIAAADGLNNGPEAMSAAITIYNEIIVDIGLDENMLADTKLLTKDSMDRATHKDAILTAMN